MRDGRRPELEAIHLDASAVQTELYSPIKPMLALRMDFKKVPHSKAEYYRVYCEKSGEDSSVVKFDGERVMIHYQQNGRIVLF